jgi:hypothetical protein
MADRRSSVLSTKPIEHIVHQGEIFQLRHPLAVEMSLERGVFGCEYPALGIIAYGNSEEEALKDFASHFAYVWHEFAMAPDSDLTPGARKLKTAIQAMGF